MEGRSGRHGQLVSAEEQDAVLEGLDEGCRVCGKDDDHPNLMFCDNCHGEYHIFCVGLQEVPSGAWFCVHCKPHRPPEHHRIDDGLDEKVCALLPRYTERFGEIVWAQGGVGFGWWPSYIFDPRHTVGEAREYVLKHMGKQHLVYFLECPTAPFSVLADTKLVKWENGIGQDYHWGKAAHAHSKERGMAFREAYRIACVEEAKPLGNRMACNHLGDDVPLNERVPLPPMKQRPSPNEQREPESDVSEKPAKRRRSSRAKKEPLIPGSAKEPSIPASESHGDLLRATAMAGPHLESALATPISRRRFDATDFADISLPPDSQERKRTGPPVRQKTPSTYYFRVFKRVRDKLVNDIDDSLGFIRLESLKSTFLDTRSAIKENMDTETLPEEMWKFHLPSLGLVSKRQEESLGPIASFLQETFVANIGDGSGEYPFHLVTVGVDPLKPYAF